MNGLDFSFQLARAVGLPLSGPELQVSFMFANGFCNASFAFPCLKRVSLSGVP